MRLETRALPVNSRSPLASDENATPAGVVAVKSGLMPNGSRAPKSAPSTVSQIRNANMPRSRAVASGPQ